MAKAILVVDDSATMTMSVKTSLEMQGFAVQTAADGVQAMTKLKGGLQARPDHHRHQHAQHGRLELIKNVKALPGFRFTPILTLTTESQPAKRDEGKKLGATGWLVKPIGGQDLVKVIRQVLPGA